MPRCDTLIRNVKVIDGTGGQLPATTSPQDVALSDGRILAIAGSLAFHADQTLNGEGCVLAPGFIDVHTHDDTSVIYTPAMLPKLSQGVTTVIVGNCGISASPVTLRAPLPDPMNLLGAASNFRYPTFASFRSAVEDAQPAVNVAALVGHTALRSNHMDQLDRAASSTEIDAMRAQLQEALNNGALGLSTGLAYPSASHASTEEVVALARMLTGTGAVYTTHLRSETAAILDALEEACSIGRTESVSVIVSHLKCAGLANWGRSAEVLHTLDSARQHQSIAWDCYPYAASSSTLDLLQVDHRLKITITWSDPHPEVAGRDLAGIAASWGLSQIEAAERLQPAGAIYHSISEQDMRRILSHPITMIGSDGLPHDPNPHPRLWGAFPRVLGLYARDQQLFPLEVAVHKMTGLPAQQFGFTGRGLIREGYMADLVLFDPLTIADTASFTKPVAAAQGIRAVYVNGILSYQNGTATPSRAGRFLPRQTTCITPVHQAQLASRAQVQS